MSQASCRMAGCKTAPERSVTWEPSGKQPVPHDGVMTIRAGNGESRYAVTEFLAAIEFHGRAFAVAKMGTDGGTYNVLVGSNGQDHYCDCPGATYHGQCRHVEGLRSLIADGAMDDPRENPTMTADLENAPF